MNLNSAQPEMRCVICLNLMSNQVFMDQCNHSFCFECIRKWSEKSHQCPQCRTKYTSFHEKNVDSKMMQILFNHNSIKRFEASAIVNNQEDKRLMALADLDNTYYDLILQQIDSI
ncbi:unnamed protein product (macronuclear) [Paramecium tetraurelia]|uniref:RING-type domain-containing protein n=1 Tax=Paramecium tetraurelia TaxID=5888 RepID=A0EBA5_PARTE|nr:uncharacterized protein GSPATT00025306001 [Paramecium tetraurelia]CAK92572.1 unnamed protein product [Paramecium tetraurelia]|eukprot:XP_001459969.1 hypothetical protein (macronuclear) [Paramecium tetraurelia strain d4-2]